MRKDLLETRKREEEFQEQKDPFLVLYALLPR